MARNIKALQKTGKPLQLCPQKMWIYWYRRHNRFCSYVYKLKNNRFIKPNKPTAVGKIGYMSNIRGYLKWEIGTSQLARYCCIQLRSGYNHSWAAWIQNMPTRWMLKPDLPFHQSTCETHVQCHRAEGCGRIERNQLVSEPGKGASRDVRLRQRTFNVTFLKAKRW